uniref:Uncharacterized protein n=1 Tax=Rhipicephalus zambeziensis TaxID=60191 RepID=A0A224YCK9_9ACAR
MSIAFSGDITICYCGPLSRVCSAVCCLTCIIVRKCVIKGRLKLLYGHCCQSNIFCYCLSEERTLDSSTKQTWHFTCFLYPYVTTSLVFLFFEIFYFIVHCLPL